MNLRFSYIVNVSLVLIVLVLLSTEAYLLFLKQKLGGNRVAALGNCDENEHAAESSGKDVYVNCSGFHS